MNKLCCTVNNYLTCTLCRDRWCKQCWSDDLTHCTDGLNPLKCPKADNVQLEPLDPQGEDPDLLVPIKTRNKN